MIEFKNNKHFVLIVKTHKTWIKINSFKKFILTNSKKINLEREYTIHIKCIYIPHQVLSFVLAQKYLISPASLFLYMFMTWLIFCKSSYQRTRPSCTIVWAKYTRTSPSCTNCVGQKCPDQPFMDQLWAPNMPGPALNAPIVWEKCSELQICQEQPLMHQLCATNMPGPALNASTVWAKYAWTSP